MLVHAINTRVTLHVENVRHLDKSIVNFLVKLAMQKQLNTKAHTQTVAAKRVRAKNANAPPSDYKALARKRGRQVSRYKEQNSVLREKVSGSYVFAFILFTCL